MFRTLNTAKLIAAVILLTAGCAISSWGQVVPTATSGSDIGAYASFGGERTHVIHFTYNSLGIDGGLFLQKSRFFGIEVRGGSFSMHARYPQAPVTAGYRVEVRPNWFKHPRLSAYIGGGESLATDAGTHYVALPQQWDPCWQASQSMSLPVGHRFEWMVYQGTWTQTYTPLRNLYAYTVTTGIVYRIKK